MIEIREAHRGDRDSIVAVVRDAFGAGRDPQEEVDIVLDTWALDATVDGLELVAVVDGEIVGHVLGAHGDLGERDVVAVAPLGVAHQWHGQGVGSALMRALLQRADDDGWPMVVLLGNPAYYGRFGFEPAAPLGIVYPPVGAIPDFQVRRLASYDPSYRGALTYCWERDRA